MNYRLHILILLIVVIVFPYPQMASALAEISQSARGATSYGGGAGLIGHIRHGPGKLVHASERSGDGGTGTSPSTPFPGHNHCGPGVGACAAIALELREANRVVAHKSFELLPFQYFLDFLPSLIPHPPKTIS